LTLLVSGLGACGGSDEADRPDELRSWSRTEVLGHEDVVPYDRIAVASDGRRTTWLTRAPGATDILGVAEWSAVDGVSPQQSDLEMPGDGTQSDLVVPGDGTPNDLVVPAAMAVDERGWIAVAQLEDEPGGRAAELAVWAGTPETPGPPATLELPEGHVLSRTVAAGRTDEVAVVVALTGRTPESQVLPAPTDLVVWTAPVSGADGTVDEDAWLRVKPALGTDLPLTTAAVIGGGGDAGLVLAGASDDGAPGMWTSSDGLSWEPLAAAAELPDEVDALDLLAPLGDGTALVGWASGGAGGAVDLWRLDGSDLTALGTVTAASDEGTIDLTGAAVAGERLVVGGSTKRRSTWSPLLWAAEADGDADSEWTASDQPELVAHLDWSIQALAADGADRMTAVMASVPFHIDVAAWSWSRPAGS
jgi:hypothetical protein